MLTDLLTHAKGVEHVDKLTLGMSDHHAEHLAADITDGTNSRITNHDFFPPRFMSFPAVTAYRRRYLELEILH